MGVRERAGVPLTLRPGIAQSARPREGDRDPGYDKLTVAGDVATLVDALGLDDVGVVGHDRGGVVAFYTAWLLGVRARGFAVVDVTIPHDLGAGADIDRGGGRWHHAFHCTSLAEELVAGREDADYRWFYDTPAARPGLLDPAVVDTYVEAYRGAERTRAGFAYYRATDADVVADCGRFVPEEQPAALVGHLRAFLDRL